MASSSTALSRLAEIVKAALPISEDSRNLQQALMEWHRATSLLVTGKEFDAWCGTFADKNGLFVVCKISGDHWFGTHVLSNGCVILNYRSPVIAHMKDGRSFAFDVNEELNHEYFESAFVNLFLKEMDIRE